MTPSSEHGLCYGCMSSTSGRCWKHSTVVIPRNPMTEQVRELVIAATVFAWEARQTATTLKHWKRLTAALRPFYEQEEAMNTSTIGHEPGVAADISFLARMMLLGDNATERESAYLTEIAGRVSRDYPVDQTERRRLPPIAGLAPAEIWERNYRIISEARAQPDWTPENERALNMSMWEQLAESPFREPKGGPIP